MARWSSSSSSSWGNSARTVSVRALVTSLIMVLIIGVVAGYLVRGNGAPKSNLQSKTFTSSNVIDPNTDGVLAASETSDGAVRAVTSFITGLPSVSLQTAQEEATVLDEVVDPNADPSVKLSFQNTIDSGRNQLVGTGSFAKTLNTKLVYSPATYKVDMLAKDRARVQVWFSLTLVDGDQQKAAANWSTADVTVRWTDHWRIASYAATGGPTPTVQTSNGQFSSYADVLNRINGFTAYRYSLGGTN